VKRNRSGGSWKVKPGKDEIIAKTAEVLSGYPQVKFGYLFGSVAEGLEREDSDVDVAVYFSEELDKAEVFELSLRIGEELESALKRRVDLIALNHAHPSIAFRAIKGEVVFERDPVERALVASRIMSRYYDFRHFFKFWEEEISRRLKEGVFGIRGGEG